jgi:hypothetical protein
LEWFKTRGRLGILAQVAVRRVIVTTCVLLSLSVLSRLGAICLSGVADALNVVALIISLYDGLTLSLSIDWVARAVIATIRLTLFFYVCAVVTLPVVYTVAKRNHDKRVGYKTGTIAMTFVVTVAVGFYSGVLQIKFVPSLPPLLPPPWPPPPPPPLPPPPPPPPPPLRRPPQPPLPHPPPTSTHTHCTSLPLLVPRSLLALLVHTHTNILCANTLQSICVVE